MALSVPQEELAELKGILPAYFFEFDPVRDLAFPENTVYLDPDLINAVDAYQRRQRLLRIGQTQLAVGLAVAAVVLAAILFASLPWLLLLMAPAMPMLITSYMTDRYGDQYIGTPRRFAVVAAGLSVICVIASGIVFFLMGGSGLLAGILSLGAGVWCCVLLRQFFFSPPEPPNKVEFCGHHEPERVVLRGREVHNASLVIPAALMRLVATEPRQNATPMVHLKTFDLVGGMPVVRGDTSNPHKLFVGMSGSGKTICFRMLMATLLPLPRRVEAVDGPNPVRLRSRQEVHQAIVYDAKTENIPLLTGHGFVPRKDLFIMNPFDRRGVAWDMARDIRSPSDASLLAEVFLQSNERGQNAEQHQYFRTNAGRQITAVIQTFIHCGGENPSWTMRDIINAFSSREVLEHVLSQHPEGGAIIDQTMKIAFETATGIYSSSTTYLDAFRIVASLWHRLATSDHADDEVTFISLEEWVRTRPRSVLLLPNSRENEKVIKPLNRLLFKRLSQLLLDSRYNQHVETGNGTKERRVIFMDECSQMGRLEGLSDLLTEGRDFGVEVLMGVQTYSQMVSAYGEQDAKTILGQCGFKAFLKADGDTAQWAGKEIGQQLEKYRKMSYTTGTSGSETFTNSWTNPGGSSTTATSYTKGWQKSESQSYEERIQDAVLASEVSGLPDPRASEEFTGYYLTPHLPVFRATLPLSWLESLLEPAGSDLRRDPMDTKTEWLPAWTPEDYERLGLKPFGRDSRAGEESGEQPSTPPLQAQPEDLFD